MSDVTALDEEEVQLFISKYLENLIGWDFKDLYNARFNMTFGDISYEQLGKVFSGEVDRNSELGKLVPDINLEDYYIDPKIKAIVDLIVLEKDSHFPINTGRCRTDLLLQENPPPSCLWQRCSNFRTFLFTFNSNISMDDLLGSWQPTEDGKIRFVESMFVQAYQSPSVVEFVECYYVKPGACGDLNTALDETAQITPLPTERLSTAIRPALSWRR